MFPNGKVVKSGEIREPPHETIDQLKQNHFTGYASFTVKDANGLHDFSVAFINGGVVGAFQESFKTKQVKLSEDVLKEITKYENAVGFFDLVSLNAEQVKLAVTVRPESEIKETQKSSNVEENIESNEEILRKYGLSSLVDHNGQ